MVDAETRKISFPLQRDEQWQSVVTESIWAERVNNGWRIDNVPWFTREVSLNDVVTYEERDGVSTYTSIVERAGHSTLRAFARDKTEASTHELREALRALGCDSELYTYDVPLLAIDVSPGANIEAIARFLDSDERWAWETGYLTDDHAAQLS